MIIVTGTKRSGTSMWMQVLAAAGLPVIGERFPQGWGELLQAANPDGFFESELIAGINFQTNPHPLTGAYLAPQPTRGHAVKVLVPGLVRTDVAFIDRCLATVRDWRAYVRSIGRVAALGGTSPGLGDEILPPALHWWSCNYGLVRDIAIRGYAAHVLTYEGLRRDPERHVAEVLTWIGHGDPREAAPVVRPPAAAAVEAPADDRSDAELSDGIDPRHLRVFDDLHATLDAERPLTQALVDALNRTDEALRPLVLEHRARVQARAVAELSP